MFTELVASTAKQKFIYELENNIPKTGKFEEIICSAELPTGYSVEFSLSSIDSEEGRMISVTARKDGRIFTRYPIRGTNAEILEWLMETDEKELARKVSEVIYECGSFYYP